MGKPTRGGVLIGTPLQFFHFSYSTRAAVGFLPSWPEATTPTWLSGLLIEGRVCPNRGGGTVDFAGTASVSTQLLELSAYSTWGHPFAQ
ncbi:hypothetical protein [Aureliella helgolandensis]|uniref:hypothetical protein n=1 Tax=Aureliella helgolandensis TaxID=2527968 RepID=UPI0011A2B565|nr:hypothetical protein [Aureliella helgolandensis]